MKKNIVLALIVTVALSATTQGTVFTDDLTTKALWHMDAPFGTWYGIYSAPDDVSVRGGNVYDRQLRLEQGGTSAPDSTSPQYWGGIGNDGSGLLQFDGVDDDAHAFYSWRGDKSSLSLDISVNLQGAIPDGERMSLIDTRDWELFLYNSGGAYLTGFNVSDGAGGAVTVWGNSVGGNAWDDIHAEVVGNNISLTAAGVTTTGSLVGGLGNFDPDDLDLWDGRVIIGRAFVGGTYYKGLIDEVRIASIPEPATLGLLGMAGAALFTVRRFRI